MPEHAASPPAVDLATRRRMQKTPRRDTTLELALRQALHRRGLRYRLHRRPVPELRREADIVFRRSRIAVFVDSCFWHRCPKHYSEPKANAAWWDAKTRRTAARDRDTDARLRQAGWRSVRVWEHDDFEQAADKIEQLVLGRSPTDRIRTRHPL